MILARNLTQRYPRPGGQDPLTVLDGFDLEVRAGEVVAVLGPSGSGKTTLLGLLAGLDRPTAGEVQLDGVDLEGLDEDARARLRAERVGFVFQNFQLVPTLTALENVMVPLELLPVALAPPPAEAAARAEALLGRVGLASRSGHYPAELSGGEQQRVGLARAFANEPQILFADEPTGNLDSKTGGGVLDLLCEMQQEAKLTMIIATHDDSVASRAHTTLRLVDGLIA